MRFFKWRSRLLVGKYGSLNCCQLDDRDHRSSCQFGTNTYNGNNPAHQRAFQQLSQLSAILEVNIVNWLQAS